MGLVALAAAAAFGLSLYLFIVALSAERWGRAMCWIAFAVVNALCFGTAMERIL